MPARTYAVKMKSPAAGLAAGLLLCLYVVGIWLEEQAEEVDKNANAKQAEGEKIDDPNHSLALVKFVGPNGAQKDAQQQGDPFASGPGWGAGGVYVGVCVGICIGVGVVDHHLGRGLLNLPHLPAAEGADHRVCRQLTPAVLAELCGHGSRGWLKLGLFLWGLFHIHCISFLRFLYTSVYREAGDLSN
jgi:hypothetical protein